jgi:primosomal replication protein N
MENNQITIKGILGDEYDLSHETHGEKFYRTTIKTVRDSGTVDVLPVLISEKLKIANAGQFFAEVRGEIRSYNQVTETGTKLILSLFAKNIRELSEEEHYNQVTLNAFLTKKPVLRTTPLGRTICDILIAVNRKTSKSDYIPCVIWGKNAEEASTLNVSDNIIIEGRLQSREYNKNGETRIAYEVSVNKFYTKPEEVQL